MLKGKKHKVLIAFPPALTLTYNSLQVKCLTLVKKEETTDIFVNIFCLHYFV